MTSSTALPTGLSERYFSAVDTALRWLGLALGIFTLINIAGELTRGPFSTLRAWIAVPLLPPQVVSVVQIAGAVVLIAHGIAPIRPRWLRIVGALLLGMAAMVALSNAFSFYVALTRGTIQTPVVLPSSLLVAGCLAALSRQVALDALPRPAWTRRRVFIALTTCLGVAALLPLILMATFGPTRYGRPADCAVVFGARVYNNGDPSLALADRVDEAIRLYHAGQARTLILSGAVDRHNGQSEPEAMRARAIAAGVSAEDIVIDEEGVDTAATVRNTARIMEGLGFTSVLAVSHYYHEPRIKMLFNRTGVSAYTVPATMSRRLLGEPYFIAREVAAYYHSFLTE